MNYQQMYGYYNQGPADATLRGRRERESLGLSPKEFQCLFIWQTFMDSFCQRPGVGIGDDEVR